MSIEEGDVDQELADADPQQRAAITVQAITLGDSRVDLAVRELRVPTGK